MTREETIQELGEWLEQMIQHGVPSHSAKRKALATAIALLADDAVQGEWEHWGSPFSDESEVIDTIVCSVCGARFIEPKDEPKGEYNYCPNCGATMNGGDDE